jgi:hypothetical protein
MNSPDLLHAAQVTLADWFTDAQARGLPALQHLISRWQAGTLDRNESLAALVEILRREQEREGDTRRP